MGDPVILTQALTNLLSNAVKFVPPGLPPRVHVRAETVECRVRLWVQDNGVGIAPGHRDRLFRLFERIDPSFPGTGVGLAIVKKAAEKIGGAVGFESEPGRGSRFWMELPAAGPGGREERVA